MSTDFINANDLNRLDRERQLTEQAPADGSPDLLGMTVGDLLVESLMNELERRLK